jgi:hypothetical protein
MAVTAMVLLIFSHLFIATTPCFAQGRIPENTANLGKIIKSFTPGTATNEVALRLGPEGTVPYGLFMGPMSFRVIDDVIYLLDGLNHRLQLFKKDKTRLITWDKEHAVTDFAVLDNHDFALTCMACRKVHIYSGREKAIKISFGEQGREEGQFLQLDMIDSDTFENLLVLDYGNGGRISRFSRKGEFLAFEGAGACTVTDQSSRRYTLRFHGDEQQFVLYRLGMDGQLQDPVWKHAKPARGSIEILAMDNKEQLYVKVFDAPTTQILRLTARGKLIDTIKAHSQPGMDFIRSFTVDPVTGKIYSLFFKAGKLHISVLN